MKRVLGPLLLIASLSASAKEPAMKPQVIIDKVYKIQTVKEKSLISFYRYPVVYEVSSADSAKLLPLLENSRKTQKTVIVTADPVTRKILDIKDP